MAVRPIKISVVADAAKARGELNSLGSSMKTGLKVAAGAGVAAVALLAKSSISAASEAQQSLGATEAIYGKYANSVVKASGKAADAVGLSANAYRESSNLLGALFKNQGVALSRLSSTTSEHLKLASDLSAMYGGTVTDAVDALTAAYKGEFNQLEKYGVTLKQDTINTKANEVAKRKYGKELKNLTPAQEGVAKQLATQQLLFKQTKDAAGSFRRESNTLAGQQQRLGAELDNVKAEIGTALLPVVTDLAQFTRREVVPAVQDFSRWLGKNQDEIRATGREIGSTLLPPLEATGKAVGETVKFFAGLPGPVKEVGLQVGIAALVFPRLAAGVTGATGAVTLHIAKLQQLRAELTYTATRAQVTSAALARVGAAAKTAAGIGGMVLLTQAAKETNQGLKDLYAVGGGALLGFSVGGPVGLAIGGAAGALIALKGSTDKAKESMTPAIKAAGSYASTLDEITGASTRATRAEAGRALQAQDAFKLARDIGIRSEDLVSAALGQEGAIRRVEAALKSNNATTSTWVDAMGKVHTGVPIMTEDALKLSRILGVESASIRDNAAKTRELSIASGQLRAELDGVRRITKNKIITRLETQGWPQAEADMRRLLQGIKLTPKQVKTVIKTLGVGDAIKDVDKFTDAISNQTPRKAKEGGKKTGRALNEGTRDGVKANKSAWENMYKTPLANGGGARPSAISGGKSVGANLAVSTALGILGGIPSVTAAAITMARAAEAAAKNELGIHSPSRVFAKIGQQSVQGFTQGVLTNVAGGAEGVATALGRITDAVRQAITGKNQGKREAAYLKSLRDEYAALKRNGRAQDVVAAKLDKARDKLRELTDQYNSYRDAITSTIKTTGDVTQLGRQDDGTVSITSLLGDLKNKVVAAQRFAVLIRDLSAKGLSQTAIQQMLDAGPEAALATAEAIASGGASAIGEINSLQAELAKTGDSLSKTMADRYFGAGVNAAKGIVKGLEAEAKSLDRAAVRMANQLVAAVKRALGIRSPSMEFRSIADQVTAGLTVQLKSNDTYVKRSGAVMAASLQKGFGTPALDAYANHSTSRGNEGQVIELRISAEQIDRLSHGEKIQATLDYARSNGVRGVTF